MRGLTLLAPGLEGPREGRSQDRTQALSAVLAGLDLAALDLLVARAEHADDGPDDGDGLEAYLAACFGVGRSPGGDVPVAALTYALDGGDPGDRDWLRLDPVHLRPDLSGLVLFDAAHLGLDAAEAASLVGEIDAYLAPEGLTVEAPVPTRWYVGLDASPRMRTTAPSLVDGRPVGDALPDGPDARVWHRRLNALQMVLHTAAANQVRERDGRPTVNSLWAWGGGAMPASVRSRWDVVWTDDPLAAALARAAGARLEPVPADGREWLTTADQGDHLVVLTAGAAAARGNDAGAWRDFVATLSHAWIRDAVTALRDRRLDALRLLTGDRRVASLSRAGLRRFWRRGPGFVRWLGR
ncbi:MAG: hypothetical protein H6983_07300 [Ectothiorhodospiraceae bacterium]|nr:hypothetical protein [Chromatiales bacterium]MCP5153952.1 hypothetical protein [Ectothiorhodospiraceae bacterium]